MRMAYRYECRNQVSIRCDRGNGKPPRKKCRACGSSFMVWHGQWGVFRWTSTNRYPAEDAVFTFSSEKQAERVADGTYMVVRFIYL